MVYKSSGSHEEKMLLGPAVEQQFTFIQYLLSSQEQFTVYPGTGEKTHQEMYTNLEKSDHYRLV